MRASLVFNGKEVACLDFDPATGSLRTRGESRPLPPADPRGPGAPGAPVPPDGPVPPAPNANPPVPLARDANAPAPATPANLADVLKVLSIGQGAEIMPRGGFWKVPLIFQNRVVGELHVSGDGTRVMEDFAAARDAAIFAR